MIKLLRRFDRIEKKTTLLLLDIKWKVENEELNEIVKIHMPSLESVRYLKISKKIKNVFIIDYFDRYVRFRIKLNNLEVGKLMEKIIADPLKWRNDYDWEVIIDDAWGLALKDLGPLVRSPDLMMSVTGEPEIKETDTTIDMTGKDDDLHNEIWDLEKLQGNICDKFSLNAFFLTSNKFLDIHKDLLESDDYQLSTFLAHFGVWGLVDVDEKTQEESDNNKKLIYLLKKIILIIKNFYGDKTEVWGKNLDAEIEGFYGDIKKHAPKVFKKIVNYLKN